MSSCDATTHANRFFDCEIITGFAEVAYQIYLEIEDLSRHRLDKGGRVLALCGGREPRRSKSGAIAFELLKAEGSHAAI